MEKYNCVIVEDEPIAAEVLEDYIKQLPYLDLKGICTDAIYAMEMLQKEKIDVVFLDIHLPRLKGLDFIKTLKQPPQIIITSAYREYALEGYELNVLDYLLKPISFNRFLMAVNKLKLQNPGEVLLSPAPIAPSERQHIFINVNKRMVKVYIDEIPYIESKKEYISIVTKEKTFLTKFQLGEIEAQLTNNDFLRIHRSYLVSKAKIDAFTATEIEIAGQQIPIGRSYKELVISQLGEKL